MDNIINVDRIIKLNDEQQKFYLRFLTRVNYELRIEVFSAHKRLFYELRQKHEKDFSLASLSYSALVLAIKNKVEEFNNTKTFNFDNLTQNEIKKISSNKAKLFLAKKTRIKSKKEKLLGYWSVVKTLKEEEGFSFRDIQEYLEKKHKLVLVHSTIHKLWTEIEEKKDTENG